MSYHNRQDSISSLASNSTVGNVHPRKIGPWRLGKTLGRGATGRVLLASHQTTGQKAAVKVVSKSELNEDDGPKKASDETSLPYGIEREIIIMKLLNHPNVLRLYDVWETSKALYLVLEYVEGGELFDLLVEQGPLQEEEAIKYFRQIILGTAYCHALGICHRDLKPENILLDGNLNVKLADFGMAALESNDKLLETSCGSPHYAAPEIVSGLKYHGSASDIWSCGVILFALLTGRLPFDDENIRDLLLKVQAGTFEIPEELSDEAKDLISKMLTVDPSQRIKTDKIISHKLLLKYPIPNEDLISFKSLPHPETASKSLGSVKNIDSQVLQNLSILWNDRSEQEIVDGLLAPGPNPEKTFYALLMRYRHNQEDSSSPKKSASLTFKSTPRKKRISQISASTSRTRPLLFQYRNGVVVANPNGKLSTASSFNNSPSVRCSVTNSPRKSPGKSPRKSRVSGLYDTSNPSLPRNLYHDIVSAQAKDSVGSTPPSLPSKDDLNLKGKGEEMDSALTSAPRITPSKSIRNSIISIASKNKLSKRKSIRNSLTTNLKRNSITVKLLATYAKLAGDDDWEYMDKQTKRTSATFATLCDKIFNQEAYDEDDENLLDEEEKRAKEYEKLMEIERRQHEQELLARRELAKQKRRLKRRSLLSSKKLSILVKYDGNHDQDDILEDSIFQSKETGLKKAPRSVSEGGRKSSNDFTKEDLENIKRRSVTQPTGARKHSLNLQRRPVSRLDPLWAVYENEAITRAKDALDSEILNDEPHKNNTNRESMISVAHAEPSKAITRENELDYKLPEPNVEDADLNEEYVSEIRKSRLLNSQLNLSQELKSNAHKGKKERYEPKSLIGNVRIPTVTRKSRCFTDSNKRLSVLSIYSTKESYKDLSSILNHKAHHDESTGMPALRTSFADRLDKVGLIEESQNDDALDEAASVIDFDDHLKDKRSSYYAIDDGDNKRYSSVKRYSRTSKTTKPNASDAPKSMLLPNTDEGGGVKDKGSSKKDLIEEGFDDTLDESDLFDNIKLPEEKHEKTKVKRPNRAGQSIQPKAETLLLPDAEKAAKQLSLSQPMQKVRQAKPDTRSEAYDKNRSSSSKTTAEVDNSKRNKSFFRKLSWGSKKSLNTNPQLPSPAESRDPSLEEKTKSKGGFFRWLSGSHDQPRDIDIKKFKTILPKQEISTALYALLNSWTNFGLKNLRHVALESTIVGQVSKHNSFNMKGCKFRIRIASREKNQKSEIICSTYKGSSTTGDTLFREIERVLKKEGVLDN